MSPLGLAQPWGRVTLTRPYASSDIIEAHIYTSLQFDPISEPRVGPELCMESLATRPLDARKPFPLQSQSPALYTPTDDGGGDRCDLGSASPSATCGTSRAPPAAPSGEGKRRR